MTLLPPLLRARLAKVVGLYVLFSVFWIFISDELLALFIRESETALWVGMAKGWLYILLTTAIWYLVIGRLFQTLGAQEQAIRALNAGLEQRVAERTLALEAEIAERRGAEAELRLSEEQLRQSQEQAARQLAEIQAYYDTAPVGLIVLDSELRYLRLNDRLAEINGHPVAAHLGRTVREMLPNLANEAEPLFRNILATGQPLRDVEITGETPANPGIPRTWRVHYYPLRNAQGAIMGLNGVVEDITAAKAAEQALRASEERYRVLSTELERQVEARTAAIQEALERVEYLAYHDDLTGLPNRAMAHQRLHQAIDAAQRRHVARPASGLAVLYLDLDRFKHINDTYGHVVGDQLLKALVQRLGVYRRTEDSLCRLGTDEFMLILTEVQIQQGVAELASLCERILVSLVEPFDLDGRQIYTSLSIGVALFPQDGKDAETLMHNADTALFEAKRAGRQTFRFFEPRMNAELTRFIQTRDALREALARREFVLHYQPKRGLRSGRIYGVEALLRWRRPEVGLVAPGDFIDVAEESGLILPIGRWVLQEACRQAAHWRAGGWTDLVVAVNLSAVQFRQGQVVADVQAALEESGLDPAGLELELTESILLQGEDALLQTLTAWKAQGIQLAIDDFGTGYSSLAYLKRFPVDKLKIDRSFIKDLLTNAEDRAIVLAIIQIARSLNLRTVAEGVDDPALAEQLKVMGCDEAQGYLYAEPQPAEELRP